MHVVQRMPARSYDLEQTMLQEDRFTCRSDDPEYDLCNLKKELYDEATNKRRYVANDKDVGFMKTLQRVVGWSPLTRNEKYFINPFVMHQFFTEAIEKLGIFSNYIIVKLNV